MTASIQPLNDPLHLREAEAAEMTGLAPSTLAKLRSRGGGPPFIKVGRAVRYPQDRLLRWLDERTQQSSQSAIALGPVDDA
jgi:predicted DNA-binding transcriptional regulator AlpA